MAAPSVLVDGQRYVPEGAVGASIGIGITTYNRNDVLAKNLEHHLAHLPAGAKLVVVDDHSNTPVTAPEGVTVVRAPENVGIARAKNLCLEALEGCEHVFLFDDDCYPLVDGWEKGYIDSPEPHLMRIFAEPARGPKLNDSKILYSGQNLVAYSHPRGMMLYVHRSVLDRVGGMDPIYGRWGYEHVDWSARIHFAGLTSFMFADIQDSDGLFWSMDEHVEITRTTPPGERKALVQKNREIYEKRLEERFSGYCDYRTGRRVVITTLYSGKPDPQRPSQQLPPDLSPAKTLLRSLEGQDVVVIHDRITEDPPENVELWQSELVLNVFFQRHLDAWRYLRDHPEVEWVWAVDATDVELLKSPWTLLPDTLYLGCEPNVVDNKWLREHHKNPVVQEYVENHGQDQLLNPGLIGGDRRTVMAFLRDLVDEHLRSLPSEDLGDMGLVQVVGRRHHAVTGSGICTAFRANEKNAWALWKHK